MKRGKTSAILGLQNFINHLNGNMDVHSQLHCVSTGKICQVLNGFCRFSSSSIVTASPPNTLHWKLVTYHNSAVKRICMIWSFSKPQLNLKKKAKPIFFGDKKHTLFISSSIVQLWVLGMGYSVLGFRYCF